jgi:hypothetical protein
MSYRRILKYATSLFLDNIAFLNKTLYDTDSFQKFNRSL